MATVRQLDVDLDDLDVAGGLCGTEAGDQRGGEWEPIKISSKFESSAYIPKLPKPSSVLTKVWSSY